MCVTRIEKIAKSVEGVSAADWYQKTTMIEVNSMMELLTFMQSKKLSLRWDMIPITALQRMKCITSSPDVASMNAF